ncbi:MAG: hypothetical protein LBK63_04775 [Treponema sp.]|jgi:hypothetical protein|nr:hypothetical protein [Treponema sp.]
MRKATVFTAMVFVFLSIAGTLYGVGESLLSLGGASSWGTVDKRRGIAELGSIRPHAVLTLSSARPAEDPSLDMALSFDEASPERFADTTGHYRVEASPALSAVNYRWSRSGDGAALFSGDSPRQGMDEKTGPVTITPQSPEALFYQGRYVKDFTLEFWLYPLNMESGETLLSWTAARMTRQGDTVFQRIQCVVARNRLNWFFLDFFSSPDDGRQMTLNLSGSPTLPRTWSHHLIRFDSDTGLLEYLVNGRLEGVTYATATGREGGEVYTPVAGEGGAMILGGRFAGLMDELRIYNRRQETPQLSRYPLSGGRLETRPLDLGERNSRVLKVEALGGNFYPGNGRQEAGGSAWNEYAGSSGLRFANDSMIQFFIRAADTPYQWTEDESEWLPFEPGTDFAGTVRGRYIQLAAVLYPSGDGEAAPYLDEIRVVYRRDDPPAPPSMVAAVARNGAVDISWRAVPDPELSGYLVYFGAASGEYFGKSATQGLSPVNAGKKTSLRIDGLENGALYYFTVASYDRNSTAAAGEFSREVSARPLRIAE